MGNAHFVGSNCNSKILQTWNNNRFNCDLYLIIDDKDHIKYVSWNKLHNVAFLSYINPPNGNLSLPYINVLTHDYVYMSENRIWRNLCVGDNCKDIKGKILLL